MVQLDYWTNSPPEKNENFGLSIFLVCPKSNKNLTEKVTNYQAKIKGKVRTSFALWVSANPNKFELCFDGLTGQRRQKIKPVFSHGREWEGETSFIKL